MEYILGPKADGCIFCLPETKDEDEKRLVLHRGARVFVMMNKYPYNSGHLLVTPMRHVMDFCDLKYDEYAELFALSQHCVATLREVSRPEGFNLGFNLGGAAGAGIIHPLLFHVFPLFRCFTWCMLVLGEVRTVPEHLTATYGKLKPFFDSLTRT